MTSAKSRRRLGRTQAIERLTLADGHKVRPYISCNPTAPCIHGDAGGCFILGDFHLVGLVAQRCFWNKQNTIIILVTGEKTRILSRFCQNIYKKVGKVHYVSRLFRLFADVNDKNIMIIRNCTTSAPKGQSALSPGQRPGVMDGPMLALKGQKPYRCIFAFAPTG